jgi:cytochrome c
MLRWPALPFAALGSLLLLAGCQARQPGQFETTFVTAIKRNVTVGGKRDRNPLPPTLDNIQQGRKVFSYYCVSCHGLDGQNTGVPFAQSLSPPVPPLSSPQVQAYADGQLHRIIQRGIFPSGMPAAAGILNDDEIWKIVLYVRRLPPRGSLGEPRQYSGQ